MTFGTKAGEVMAAVKYYLSIGHSPGGMPTRQVGSFELDEQRWMHVYLYRRWDERKLV